MPRSAIREIMSLAAGREDVIRLEVERTGLRHAFRDHRAGFCRGTAGCHPLFRQCRKAKPARRCCPACFSLWRYCDARTRHCHCWRDRSLVWLADGSHRSGGRDPNSRSGLAQLPESIVILAGGMPVRYELPESTGFIPRSRQAACPNHEPYQGNSAQYACGTRRARCFRPKSCRLSAPHESKET